VSISTPTSSYSYVRGRKFRVASSSIKTVNISSALSLAFPRTFQRQRFAVPIKRSKNPPHQGALSKLNFQSIRLLSKCSLTSCFSCNRLNNFSDALKVLVLSEIISDGFPLRAANLRRQRTKVLAVRSFTRSRVTARVTQHVNRAM